MKKLFIFVALLILSISFTYAQTEDWLWARQVGGSTYDAGEAIATDSDGNSYVTGYFYGTATFGDITLSAGGESDIFIAKLDPAGNFLWVKQAGGPGIDSGEAIATDNEGNCYVIGHFTAGYYVGNASFGPTTFTTGGSCISKLDTNGNWLWTQKVSYSSNATALSIDSSGNCYLTGDFRGSQTFGSTTLSSSSSSFFDLFVAKLDTSGNWLWARQAGGSSGSEYNNAFGRGIATDSEGNCYLTGDFKGTVSFGSTSYTTGTYIDYGTYNCSDLFISKLDTIGNWLWTKRVSGNRRTVGNSIATDSSGHSYVTGEFEGTTSFGDTVLSGRGYTDIFIARLNGNGDWLWVKQAGGTNFDYARAITVDSSGNSYITGYFSGTATFGTTPLSCVGNTDIFIAKLDTSGNWLWAQRAGGGYDKGRGITIDGDDNCYVTGCFSGTATFGDHSVSNSGGTNMDIFIAKYGMIHDSVEIGPDGTAIGATVTEGGNVPESLLGPDTGHPAVVYTISSTGVKDVIVYRPASYGAIDWYCWLITPDNQILEGIVDASNESYLFESIDFDAKGDVIVILNDNLTLPVELSSFAVNLNSQNNAVLNWVTQSETGVNGFYIYRNTEDLLASAQLISDLIPATNSSQQQEYTFSDTELYIPSTYYYWLQSSDLDGGESYHGPISLVYVSESDDPIPEIVRDTQLKSLYPNPFNPSSTISYYLAETEPVSIHIYSSRGQLVRSFDEGIKAAGDHSLVWNGDDDRGKSMPTGLYYIRMQAGDKFFNKKAVILK